MLASLLLALAAAADTCTLPDTEVERQRLLPYAAFDSTPGPHGWRQLNGQGCTEVAVSLLTAYASANAGRLTSAQDMEIAFHAGQAFAMAGQHQKSIAHFERALAPGATPERRAYVEATLAFLKHDRQALVSARERYASVAPGSMRLRFIDGFLACPDASYVKAVHCRP